MTAFSDLDNVFFGLPDFAYDAVYTPPDGDPVALKVLPIMRDPDADGLRVRRGIVLFEARVADLPAPVEGATLVVDGVTYRLQGRPSLADEERVAWHLEVYEVTA